MARIWKQSNNKRTLVVRGYHDVANDGVRLGLRASLVSVALVGACAILECLLCCLGKLDIAAVEVRLAAGAIRDLIQAAGVLGQKGTLIIRGDYYVTNDGVRLCLGAS